MAKRESLLHFLYRKLGYRKGTKAAAFIVAWGIYADSLPAGESPIMDGYWRYWKTSTASAYRELAVFREAFPDDERPDRVWAKLSAAVESRRSLSVAIADASRVEAVWT